MKKILEILQHPAAKGDVGIEIECEGMGLREVKNKYWNTVKDGSLRGHYPDCSAEFVLKAPILLKEVKEALDNLKDSLPDAKFNFSFRTSVHVHVNVQQLTEVQLINLVYTYLLIEEPLMNYCGKDRKGNRFCLRLQDAEALLGTVNELIDGGVNGLARISEENIRYAALNLAAVRKYGSIEFRGMRGTMEQDILLNWINACVAIRRFAEKMESPEAVYELYSEKGAKEFLAEVLQEYTKPFLYPKMEKDIQRSFSLSIDVPHAFSRMKNKPVEEAPKAAPRRGGRIALDPAPIHFADFIAANPGIQAAPRNPLEVKAAEVVEMERDEMRQYFKGLVIAKNWKNLIHKDHGLFDDFTNQVLCMREARWKSVIEFLIDEGIE